MIKVEKRQRCKLCTSKKLQNRTNNMCLQCKIYLCYVNNRNCFSAYHVKLNYLTARYFICSRLVLVATIAKSHKKFQKKFLLKLPLRDNGTHMYHNKINKNKNKYLKKNA